MPGGAADHFLRFGFTVEPRAVSLGGARLSDAAAAARRGHRPWPWSRRWLAATAAVVVLGAAFVGSEVRFNWLPLTIGDFRLGKDPGLAAVDWTSLRQELDKRGLLDRPGVVVAATRWLDAGKIDYALGGRAPVICLGSDPREYGIIAPVVDYAGADVLIVAPGISPAAIAAALAAFSI